MILDTLINWSRSVTAGSRLAQGCDYLARTDLVALPDGRHDIDGDRLFVLLSRDEGRGEAAAKLEAHRRYIDIQLVLEGHERMGWRALDECAQPTAEYRADRDIVFFSDEPALWFDLPPGHFVIFRPSDAHAPLAGTGSTRKAVVKVALDE